MDTYFSSQYQTSGPGHLDDWIHPAYFDHSGFDQRLMSTLADDHFDTPAYIEPNMLDWAEKPNKYVFASGYQVNRDGSVSSARSNTPGLSDDGECFPSNDSLPQTPDDECPPPNGLRCSVAQVAQPEQPVKRKRGRPRIVRAECDTTDSKAKSRVSKRLPHNQVERKYREGLNAELERLRLAIPTLPHRDAHALNGPPKPSKATVLSSAIDYIHQMEAERDRLRRENDALRVGRNTATPTTIGGYRHRAWS